MAEIKAFLFDLDGTLVDTRESNYLAYRDAFAELGHELTRDSFATTWGKDSRQFIPELLPHVAPEEVQAIRDAKARAYGGHLRHSRLNADLVELARCARTAVATGLVTTAKRTNVEQTLSMHGIADLFEVTVNGDDVAMSKPDPEAYRLALRLLGLPPGAAVAFEDSDAGAAAAEGAGIDVVRVDFGG